MSARQPRFEIVRGDAGWWARFRAANGRVVWTTETYRRRIDAAAAIRALDTDLAADAANPNRIRQVDEREVQP